MTLEQMIAERIAAQALALAEQIIAVRYARDAYSVAEAAQRLSLSPDLVRKLVARGDLHAVQTTDGGRLLIPAWSIARFLETPEDAHGTPQEAA